MLMLIIYDRQMYVVKNMFRAPAKNTLTQVRFGKLWRLKIWLLVNLYKNEQQIERKDSIQEIHEVATCGRPDMPTVWLEFGGHVLSIQWLSSFSQSVYRILQYIATVLTTPDFLRPIYTTQLLPKIVAWNLLTTWVVRVNQVHNSHTTT
jgi:hypothetical protein